MAEFEDGNRMFERAYETYNEAVKAAEDMIKDVRENTDWKVVAIVEEIEFVTKQTPKEDK